VKKHAGTTPQSDDIAILMIRWKKAADTEEYNG
jgi:hypothetical protein